MSTTTPGLLLWGVAPYVALVLLIGGTAWRHKYDRFGWTTRSSQLMESRFLRWASPLFHYGILGVIAGHLLGLPLPETWTAKIHIDEHTYHEIALIGGVPTGVVHDYREGISLWFRGLFTLDPRPERLQAGWETTEV